MSQPIFNAGDQPLNFNSGTVPDVSGAMLNWFQPLTFTTIVKTVINFQVVETPTDVTYLGVWQPFTEKQIMYKPEGQRAWSWYWLHAEPGLILKPDDVVTYLGVQFRVRSQKDYRLYGYVEYQLTEDYIGSGPA